MSKKTSPDPSNKKVIVMVAPQITPQKRHALELKIDIARWFCLRATPFYGQLMMGLKDVLDPFMPTAATDGRRIMWGVDFLEKLTDEEVRFVLIHETLHCAYGHLWRFDFKDPRSNIACDHAINLNILAASLAVKMPEGGLADQQYKGLAEEEIYHRLPTPPPNGGKGQKGEKGGNDYVDVCGGFTSPDEGDSESDDDGSVQKDGLKDDWQRRVISAAQAAKALGQGTLPADLQRIIDEALTTKIDWKREMADFVKNCHSEKNDWTRSPKRHAWLPVVMPRKKADNISKVVFVRDTSGSVGKRELCYFNGMIDQCMAETGAFGYIFDCDADVHHTYEIGPGDSAPKEAKGGGGTDFRPPFEKCKEIIEGGEEIAGLIYITDMAGTFPQESDYPDFPTLWISITKDQVAPFGRTVVADLD